MKLRNTAIIAHVDHGKTTLVDELLKQSNTFRENEAEMEKELILDSNDQEKERGITILAKNTSVTYKDTKINIIDTPGHADFGGEVERTLNMAEGAILIIDAAEGPMPQTKFVLQKALELDLKVIVVINKIDKKNANIEKTLNETESLFLELAQKESQLDFPVIYAIGRDGKAWTEKPENTEENVNLKVLFEEIVNTIPSPKIDKGEFQMLITSLMWDNHRGKYALGKINKGEVKKGDEIILINSEGEKIKQKVDGIFLTKGLERVEVSKTSAGEIAAITGAEKAKIGDTLASPKNPEPLPRIKIEEPTLKIALGPNTSPLSGTEGDFVTSRQILDRIKKELETNIAMKMDIKEDGTFLLSGRGELHLSVFLENLRREGYEMEVGKPQVITKTIDGKEHEPIEELVIDVNSEYTGNINSAVGQRKGILKEQKEVSDNQTRLIFEIPTRGLLGLKSTLIAASKGTAVINNSFLKYEIVKSDPTAPRNGALIASEKGKASSYGLNVSQGRGVNFIEPGEDVYQGMIIGLNSKQQDLEVNVCKTKTATNVRKGGLKDEGIYLSPPLKMSLEQAMNFIKADELVEITPKNIRLRKRILDPVKRKRAKKS